MNDIMAFLLPFKGSFQRTRCCPGIVCVVFFLNTEHRNHSTLRSSLVSLRNRHYSYFAVIQRNRLLLLVTLGRRVWSALSLRLLLIVKFLLSPVKKVPSQPLCYLFMNCFLNSAWFLQSLQTPRFLCSSTKPTLLSASIRLTHTVIQGKTQQSTQQHTNTLTAVAQNLLLLLLSRLHCLRILSHFSFYYISLRQFKKLHVPNTLSKYTWKYVISFKPCTVMFIKDHIGLITAYKSFYQLKTDKSSSLYKLICLKRKNLRALTFHSP